ncbi:hypothetical protein EI94DRAFT_579134 [Lactarius quietus]|nr:hypothetical protein EI94DRAFT_579134 [Lactarius quietus]
MVQKRTTTRTSVGVANGSSVLQGQLRHSPLRTFCTMTGSPELLQLPTPFHQLSSLLEAQPESLISGNKEIQDAALRATEHVFNIDSEKKAQPYISALLASFSPAQAPVTRSQSVVHGKRKRSPSPPLRQNTRSNVHH